MRGGSCDRIKTKGSELEKKKKNALSTHRGKKQGPKAAPREKPEEKKTDKSTKGISLRSRSEETTKPEPKEPIPTPKRALPARGTLDYPVRVREGERRKRKPRRREDPQKGRGILHSQRGGRGGGRRK